MVSAYSGSFQALPRQIDITVVLFSVTVITPLTGGANTGGERPGEGAITGQGGGTGEKGPDGGSSTGALCTRFTLVFFDSFWDHTSYQYQYIKKIG